MTTNGSNYRVKQSALNLELKAEDSHYCLPFFLSSSPHKLCYKTEFYNYHRKYTLFCRLRQKQICKVGISLPIMEITLTLIVQNSNTNPVHQSKAWFFFRHFHFKLKPRMIWGIILLLSSTPAVNNLRLLNLMDLLGNVSLSLQEDGTHLAGVPLIYGNFLHLSAVLIFCV